MSGKFMFGIRQALIKMGLADFFCSPGFSIRHVFSVAIYDRVFPEQPEQFDFKNFIALIVFSDKFFLPVHQGPTKRDTPYSQQFFANVTPL